MVPSRRPGCRVRGGFVLEAILFLLLAFTALPLFAQAEPHYERQVDVAPTEEVIGEGYETPVVQRPKPMAPWRQVLDMALLGGALLVSAWLVLGVRSRPAVVAFTAICLAYFGFYREGCICPIGSIQNIAVAAVDPTYGIPYYVIAIFVLPLFAALFFGRVFCGGVCALGGIQELILIRPIKVPAPVDRVLGSIKWIYLVSAILLAVLPATDRDFIICRFDPFVGFFRFSGTLHMFLIGGAILLIGLFVGRPYCRYLCPYGALLSVFSRVAGKSVSITPSRELDCGLCNEACPYGAIEQMRAIKSTCLACARCFDSCPVHRSCPSKSSVEEATSP